MNVHAFMDQYAPHLMTDYSEEMNTLLSDQVFRSQMDHYSVRITPHPFKPEETAILLDQRGGTFLHTLERWEKNPQDRLQIVTGTKTDPNGVWMESLESFLKHERLYRKYPDVINEINTQLKTGYVSVYFPDLAESDQEALRSELFQKGYDCTLEYELERPYLTWYTYGEISVAEACRFIDTYQQLIKGAV